MSDSTRDSLLDILGTRAMERGKNLFAQRAAEKERSREEDKRRVQEGKVSSVELRAENSFLNLSGGVRIVDFGRSPHRPGRQSSPNRSREGGGGGVAP